MKEYKMEALFTATIDKVVSRHCETYIANTIEEAQNEMFNWYERTLLEMRYLGFSRHPKQFSYESKVNDYDALIEVKYLFGSAKTLKYRFQIYERQGDEFIPFTPKHLACF